MNAINDETRTSGTKDHKCNSQNAATRLELTGGESQKYGSEQNQVFGSNSTGRNLDTAQDDFCEGQGDFGKILRQLRELKETHLAYVDSQQKNLESQLASNAEHRQEISESIDALENQLIEILEDS